MDNPIVKLVTAWTYRKGGPARAIRQWGYRCPDCGDEAHVTYYGGLSHTRKGARDLYYRHRRQEHTGTG